MEDKAHPFRQFYRNITFDTLKERHDNFSFSKASDSKAQVYDTMHFKGLLDRPTDPVMVVYQRMQEEVTDNGMDQVRRNRASFQADNYGMRSENST